MKSLGKYLLFVLASSGFAHADCFVAKSIDVLFNGKSEKAKVVLKSGSGRDNQSCNIAIVIGKKHVENLFIRQGGTEIYQLLEDGNAKDQVTLTFGPDGHEADTSTITLTKGQLAGSSGGNDQDGVFVEPAPANQTIQLTKDVDGKECKVFPKIPDSGSNEEFDGPYDPGVGTSASVEPMPSLNRQDALLLAPTVPVDSAN